jgi:hypothetical protein
LEWCTIIRAILPSITFSEATIYIADNASTDESIAFVQQHPAIKIIKCGGFKEALKMLKYMQLNRSGKLVVTYRDL